MAKLRSEHSPIIPFHCLFQKKGGPQRPPVPERDYFCAGRAIYACFLPSGKVARIFPLHSPGVLERRRFGAASQRWKDICQSFLEVPESMVVLEAACPLWGGHLQVLDNEASLWQRCLILISSCTMPSITWPVTSFWYRGDTKWHVLMPISMKSLAFLHCLC